MGKDSNECTNYITIVLRGEFKLKAPLSHIGEAISTNSYLSEEPIVQPDGTVVPVFSYSGNALRGQLRDHAAIHYLTQLGVKVPLKAFHLLFSGGAIQGDQKIDLEWRRKFRELCPPGSLFGGGIGSGMVEGKCCIGISYPVCKETLHILDMAATEKTAPYGELTAEKSYTRFNDAKNDKLAKDHLAVDAVLDEEKKDGEVSQQMRFTAELVAAGSTLVNRMVLTSCEANEIGVFVAALKRFHDEPFLGGQRSRGHGACTFAITEPDDAIFISGGQGRKLVLSKCAWRCLEAYETALNAAKPEEVLGFLETIK